MLCEPEEDVDMTVVEDEDAEEEGGLLKLLLLSSRAAGTTGAWCCGPSPGWHWQGCIFLDSTYEM